MRHRHRRLRSRPPGFGLRRRHEIDDQIRRCRSHAVTDGYRVVTEYTDAAISGSHIDRADMQRLLASARAKGGTSFRAVLVDDLSRLSRDLGDTWQIVFRNLASVDIRVIDGTTGLASDGAGARLTFGALALVNDTFLQLVRTETHRGLEARALGGFSTGGRCYGYATVAEENPPDLEHPRKRFIIDETEAAVVRRVFQLCAEGASLKNLASMLNEERLPAPNDNGRGNKNGHGWGHTTVRAMISNERYVGRVVWNQSKWVSTARRETAPRVVPHPAAIAGYLKNLWTLLDTDPARGRDVLARFVAPVVLTPMNAEGPRPLLSSDGAFNLSFFLSGDFSGSGISGCAGAQCGLCTAILLGFERRLVA